MEGVKPVTTTDPMPVGGGKKKESNDERARCSSHCCIETGLSCPEQSMHLATFLPLTIARLFLASFAIGLLMIMSCNCIMYKPTVAC